MSDQKKILSKLKKLQKTKNFKKAQEIVKEEFSKVNTTSYTPLEITGIVLLSILGFSVSVLGWATRVNSIKFGKKNKKNKKNDIKKATENVSTKLKKDGYKPLEIVAIILIVLFGIPFTIMILGWISLEIKYARRYARRFGKKNKKKKKKK